MSIELTPEEFRRQYDIPQDAQFVQEPTEQNVWDAKQRSFWSNPPTHPAVDAPYYHTRQGLELADNRLADRQANLLSGVSADSILPDRPQSAGLGIAQDNPEPYGGFDLRDSAQPGQSSGGVDWQSIRSGVHKAGLAMEAFGAGVDGREPLYLKLRQQQALEDQHKMVNEQNKSARLLDLMKFQQAQQHQHLQAFLEADKIADPKQRKAVGVSFEQQGNPYGKLLQVSKEANGMKPLIGWLNQENPGLAGQLESALPNMSTDEVKHWMDMLTPMYKQFTEQQTKANALQRLNAIKNPSPTELMLKENLQAELTKAQEESTSRKLQNQGAALGNQAKAQDIEQKGAEFPGKLAATNAGAVKAQVDAQVATATVNDQVREAQAKAATSGRPQHFEAQIGDNAVTLIEDGLGSGKYHVLAVGGQPVQGQKKPLVEINDTKPMTPEQAGRFSQYMSAIRDLDQLKPVLFRQDEKGNIIGVNRSAVLSAAVGGIPFTKGRDLKRFMSDAIEAKLRAETGAAAPEQEVNRIWERFGPKALDSDEQIISKFNNLSEYLRDTIAVSDPYAIHQGRAGERQPMVPFDDRYEQLKKKGWTDYMIFSHMKAEGYGAP